MFKKIVFFILICVTIGVTQQVWAWGQHTHKVICDIAWRELSAEAKREVRKLLKKAKQRTFAQACTWPDHIRSNSRYDFTKPYHYINVSDSATSINLQRDCGLEGCVLEAVAEYANVLRGIKSDKYLNNPAKALMFLGHFLADLHQPLHVAYARDRGGNETFLRYAAKKYSLHYVWDVLIPDAGLTTNWRADGSRLAGKISNKDRHNWQQGTPMDWGNESLKMVSDIYQNLEPNMNLQYRDFRNWYPDAERRMMQAGVRLAATLNDIFK